MDNEFEINLLLRGDIFMSDDVSMLDICWKRYLVGMPGGAKVTPCE